MDEKPLVNLWRSPHSGDFPTRRLLSSLRFAVPEEVAASETLFYRLLGAACLLRRHARGEGLEQLAQEHGVHTGALETGLKQTTIWVLNCLAQTCTGARCYKLDFLALQIYPLIEDLSLGSSLGKLLTIRGVGRATVERLQVAGIREPSELRPLDQLALVAMGVARKQADAIVRFSRRQSR